MADVNAVASRILDETGPIEAMKLQKLLYYAQAWHAAVTGDPLFPNTIEAWRQGPVVREVFDRHRGRRKLHDWSGDAGSLDANAGEIIRLVCRQYGHYTGDELSAMTHREGPWREAREGLPSNASSQRPIPVPRVAEYYRSGRTLLGQYASDIAVAGASALSGHVDRIDVSALLQTVLGGEPAGGDVIGAGQGLDGVRPPASARRVSLPDDRA